MLRSLWLFAIFFFLSSAAFAQSSVAANRAPAEECAALPSTFTPSRTARSDQHRQALQLISDTGGKTPNRANRAAALIQPMQALLAQAVARSGPASPEAGILMHDLASLIGVSTHGGRPDSVQAMRGLKTEAQKVLSGATTREAVEVWVDLAKSQGTPPGQTTVAHASGILARYRRVAGDTLQSVPLWKAVLDAVKDDARAKETYARAQLAAAERSDSVSWRLRAQEEMIETRLAVLAPRAKLNGPEHVPVPRAIEMIRNERARAAELLPLARAMTPHFPDQSRPFGQIGLKPCVSQTGFEWYRLVMLSLGTREEAMHAFRVGVWRAATPDSFATDFLGGLSNIEPILAARAIDRGLYLQAMAQAGEDDGSANCRKGGPAPEICAMSKTATALINIRDAGAATQVLRDAIEIAGERGIVPSERVELILQLAEVEWQSGSASQAPILLSQAEALIGDGKTMPKEQIRVLKLRAIIADAQLDDGAALNAFDKIVRLSIDWSRRGPSNPVNRGDGSPDLDPVAKAAHAAARDLVHQHVRRRFCAECAMPEPYAKPAIEWLGNLFDPSALLSFVPEPGDFLLTAALPESVWAADAADRAEKRFRATLHLQSGQIDVGATKDFEYLKKTLPRNATLRTQLRVLSLRNSLSDIDITDEGEKKGKRFVQFLQERDLTRKRQLWKSYAQPIVDDSYGQFGSDEQLHFDLDALVIHPQ